MHLERCNKAYRRYICAAHLLSAIVDAIVVLFPSSGEFRATQISRLTCPSQTDVTCGFLARDAVTIAFVKRYTMNND